MLDEPIRRATDKTIIERGVAHIADNQQVEVLTLHELANRRHCVPGNHMRVEADALRRGLRGSARDYGLVAMASVHLVFYYLFNGGRKAGHLLDANHVQRRAMASCHANRR